MKLRKNELKNILLGVSLLGTGGGGRFDMAQKILQKISKPVQLRSVDELKDNDFIATVFMVGGLKKKGDATKGAKKSIELLQKILNKKIKYLVPVEIGPTAVLDLLYIASEMNLPVIDGDFVGFRSAPEIYVEAITLNNVNRLPIAVVNLEGDSLVLYKTSSIQSLETILRDFSARSKSQVYVAGYPVTKNQIKNYFGKGSVSFSQQVGKCLIGKKDNLLPSLKDKGFIFIDSGRIINQEGSDNKGFTSGKLLIKAAKNIYEVIYKNENIVLLKNKIVLVTSPDSIILLDLVSKVGINNGDNNRNKEVYIFVRKAIPVWRTKKGRQLFSPKNLGLEYKQKLL